MPHVSNIRKYPPLAAKRAAIFPGSATWLAVIATGIVDAAWLTMSERLSLNPASLLALAPSVAVLAILALYCRSYGSERLQKLHVPMMGALFIVSGFMALRLLDHLAMSVPFPFVDDGLARLDTALGFDWLAYATWISHHHLLIVAFHLVYTGLTLVALIIFILLLVAAGPDRAKEFARLVFWTGLAATVIGAFFPAKAAMVRFASPALLAAFGPDAGMYPLPYLSALRSGMPHVLDLRELPGLVAIPSFHTACGLLIAYCCRGIRWISPLALLYSAIMIASTPIMGGHYFVDLIAGGCLTVVVVAADRWIAFANDKTGLATESLPVAASPRL